MNNEQAAKRLGLTVAGLRRRAEVRGLTPTARVGEFKTAKGHRRRSVVVDWSEAQVSALAAPRKEAKDG